MREDEAPVPLTLTLTEDELKAMVEEAYQNGREAQLRAADDANTSFNEGYKAGHAVGFALSQEETRQRLNEAEAIGHRHGYAAGYEIGFAAGKAVKK